MQPCTLEVGERVVVESAGGPLEAEYALFDAGGIELLSDGPGTIREAGYLTTAADARVRLEAAGITDALAAEVAAALQPSLAQLYALGPAARKMSAQLGPGELFESRAYEAGARQYVGRWLDLEALARDAGVFRATAVLQAIFLSSLLGEVPPTTRIFMSTLGYTRDRRPGERTFRRVQLEGATEIAAALRTLAESPPPAQESRTVGPSRAELLDAVNVRLAAATNETARTRLHALARQLMVRDAPARGPLADPELWAIEGQLSYGDLTGVVEKLDAIEKTRGRLPGTAYLRARTALMLRSEKPQQIAERVSSLASNMNTFFELELLAAEAWKAAGDSRKAKAFARDLVENPNAPDELRIRALDILDTRSSQLLRASPPSKASDRPAASARAGSSRPPREAKPESKRPAKVDSRRSESKPDSRRPASLRGESRRPTARTESRRPDARREQDDEAPDTAIDPTPVVQVERVPHTDETMRDRIPSALSKPPPAAAPSVEDIPPPPKTPVMDPPRKSAAPLPRTTRPLRSSSNPPQAPPQPAPPGPSPQPPVPQQMLVHVPQQQLAHTPQQRPAHTPQPPEVTKQSTSYDPGRPTAQSSEIIEAVAIPVDQFPVQRRSDRPPPFVQSPPPPARPPSNPPDRPPSNPPPLASTLQSPQSPAFMRGASQPPFKLDTKMPPPMPRSPPPPRGMQGPTELAEALSLPPGLHGQPPPRDELPKNVIDARVAFTHLSRELGREYRQRLRIELRTDVPSIEAMQRYLHERFADGQIKSHEDAYEVRRHGAFLSEILARQLGAYWVDIGPSELGYWAMVVGNGTRVFPFGRVLRFVQMGHKERDLVSYYLELEVRARG